MSRFDEEYSLIEIELSDKSSSTVFFSTGDVFQAKEIIERLDNTIDHVVLSIYSEETGETDTLEDVEEMKKWVSQY